MRLQVSSKERSAELRLAQSLITRSSLYTQPVRYANSIRAAPQANDV